MKKIIDMLLVTIKQNSSLKFRLGFLLLLINVPIGWILGPLLGLLCGWLFSAAIGGAVAVFFYVTSWAMLGLGVLLAGKDGYQIFKQLVQEFKKQFFSKKQPTPAEKSE